MKQFLQNNYKLHFQKIRLLFILLFSLFYFDGFAQNINVAVRRDNILFFADPNNGMGFSNGDDCSGGPDLRVFNRLWINGAGPFDDNISYEDHSGVTSAWWNPNSPALFNWFVSPVGGIPSNSTLSIEQKAYESDGFVCGSDDADCGGYQALLLPVYITNRFACHDYFKDSQWCTGGNDSRYWGLGTEIYWEWESLNPGTITNAISVCEGANGVWIKSSDVGTTPSKFRWQKSENGGAYDGSPSLPQDASIVRDSFYLDFIANDYHAGDTIKVRRLLMGCGGSVAGLISAPVNVYSNVCTIYVRNPVSTPATATPSETTPDCGSFTLTNPVDPLNNTTPFTWEFQYSTNNGSSWITNVYSTPPTVPSNNTTANRTVCIRMRAVYENNCGTVPWQSYCWFQYANPKGPTLDSMYPDPNFPLLCNGDGGVWATFNSGTGNGSNQYQYTVNGTTWLTYTPGQVIPVPLNRDIEIRGRRVASAPGCSSTGYTSLAFWPRNTIVTGAAVNAPSLNTKTPNTATICKGTDVSATVNNGSGGGSRANTQREFSIDGGVTWSAYTSGTTITTTNAVDSVLIRVRRNDGYGTAPLYRLYCSTDWQTIAKWNVINPLVSLQSFSLPVCYAANPVADITAFNPSPGVGIWSIQSGAGSLSSTTTLNTTITGLTAGSATSIRWSVTQSGCTKNFDTTITPVATSVANLTNGGLCQTCPVKNGNSYNFYDNTGKIMAKIDDLASPATELSTTEVCVGIDASVQTVTTNLGAIQSYLQRHFSIKPVTNTNTTVTLYFSATEFNNLRTACTATPYVFTNVNQLIVSKFPGGSNNIYSRPDTSGGIFITPTASGFDAANGYYFVTLPVSTFSTFYIHSTYGIPTVLPIELTYFTVACESNKIKIDWQTASENNNHHFEIERSENAIDFTTIISVPTQNGNSNQTQNYLVYDNEPKNTKLYYRLKQIDNNGQFANSKIVETNCQYSTEKNIVVSVYPNPTEDILNVFINSLEDASATVKFYDLNTSLILQKQIDIIKGNNLLDVSLKSMPQGMYFVEISNSNGVLYKNKIIKR